MDMGYNVADARGYLETGGLGETLGLALMAVEANQPKVQMDTDMAVALCQLAADALAAKEAANDNEAPAKAGTPAELTDLIGKRVLDAVDFGTESRKRWSDDYEDCQVCRFRLDGTVYLAVEDPDDGYRSSMKELIVQADATLSNVFQPVEVVGVHRTKYEYGGKSDVLELIDTTTGKVVLEVGTENTDDYYPSFVASFHPENMAVNAAA